MVQAPCTRVSQQTLMLQLLQISPETTREDITMPAELMVCRRNIPLEISSGIGKVYETPSITQKRVVLLTAQFKVTLTPTGE